MDIFRFVNTILVCTVFLNLILGLFVFRNNPNKPTNRRFFLFAAVLAGWVFGLFMFQMQPFLFWGKFLYTFACLIPFSFNAFLNKFLYAKKEQKIEADLVIIFLAMIPVLYLLYSNLILASVVYPEWGVDFEIGRYYSAFTLYFIPAMLLGFVKLILKHRRADTIQKQQIKCILLGVFLAAFIGSAVAIVLPSMGFSRLYNLAPTSSLLIVLFTTLAIAKFKLMDILLVVNRTVALITTILLLGSIYLGLMVLYRTYISAQIDLLFFILSMLYVVFVGEVFIKIRLYLQRTADRAFIRNWYDFDALVAEITERLATVLEIEQVFMVIESILREKLEVDKITIFVSQKDKAQNPVVFRSLVTGKEKALELNLGHPVVSYFLNERKYITSYEDLDKKIKEIIRTSKSLSGIFYLPFYSSVTLEGFMILGKKASEDPYNETDLNLFRTILFQLVPILDRIRPYEKIKNEFEENQKKLYDTERLLARSEKIASMAGLIQEYNHEIKTPLAIIKGEAERLTKEPRDMEYIKWFQDLVLRHINRANDIVESTLRLSSPKKRQEEDVNLNDVINDALQLFPPNGVHLIKELNPVPAVRGDRNDLQTVFINLVKNAVEAMPEGGDLKIRTYAEKEDHGTVVWAEVSDTGVGIPEENMEKIFEPFFATHVTKGRGLGLSIVFRIIREHLGKIEVKSKVGAGSTFRVQLRAIGG